MERAVVDDHFKKLSEELSFKWLYHGIETMNNTQQEMKWSTHPKMMIELAVIQLMNKPNVRSESPQVEAATSSSALEEKVKKLESMLNQLQKQGIQAKPEEKSQTQQKRTRKVPQANKTCNWTGEGATC